MSTEELDIVKNGRFRRIFELSQESKVSNEVVSAKSETARKTMSRTTGSQKEVKESVRHASNVHPSPNEKRIGVAISSGICSPLHNCSRACTSNSEVNLQLIRQNENPLKVPINCGWSREFICQETKLSVFYRTPCGQRLRSIQDVFQYLQWTRSELTMDLFSFDIFVNPLLSFYPETIMNEVKDISCGREVVNVQLVNSIDMDLPRWIDYSPKPIAREGLAINLNTEFLSGCDCIDDCQNKESCQCQLLTVEETKACSSGKIIPEAGYHFRRLTHCLDSGIYECNSMCKCKSSCLNRVIQNGLQARLQVFKTRDKGWGLRCIDDLPRGTFVGIYAGKVSKDQDAKIDARDNGSGSVYQMNLDFIENVEDLKEGYESTCNVSAMDETLGDSCYLSSEEELGMRYEEEDSDYQPGSPTSTDGSTFEKLTPVQKKGSISEGRCGLDEENSKELCKRTHSDNKDEDVKSKSLRSFFDEKHCYVVDAVDTGNLLRYVNHSCEPNIFNQSVFVETHDVRFPWVAYFTSKFIAAGTELTMDYNYKVGSDQDHSLPCHCGAKRCQKILL